MVVVTADSYRGFQLAEMHAELRERCEWVTELVVVPGPETLQSDASGDESWLPEGAITWEDLIEEGRFSSYDRAAVDLCRPGPNDVCEMMFTSGTTGLPKGVMHTHNILSVAVDAFLDTVCEGLEPHPGAGAPQAYVTHMASTLGHQTGYLYGMRLPLYTGGHVRHAGRVGPRGVRGAHRQAPDPAVDGCDAVPGRCAQRGGSGRLRPLLVAAIPVRGRGDPSPGARTCARTVARLRGDAGLGHDRNWTADRGPAQRPARAPAHRRPGCGRQRGPGDRRGRPGLAGGRGRPAVPRQRSVRRLHGRAGVHRAVLGQTAGSTPATVRS